jgi:hypothetical protein
MIPSSPLSKKPKSNLSKHPPRYTFNRRKRRYNHNPFVNLDAAHPQLSGFLSPVTGFDRKEKSIMSAAATGGTFAQDSMKEIVTRWKVAEEYLSYLDIELLPREHALRVLVRQDVPTL